MPENVPPTTTPVVNNTADQPGRPYYESLRANLRQTLEKKRKLDEQLAVVEDQIFKSESAYLEDTATSGNIVRGFDGWVKGVQVGGRTAADDRRRGRIREEDRVFSRSSVSWIRVSASVGILHLSRFVDAEQAQDEAESVPQSHAATPTSMPAVNVSSREGQMPATKPANKKKRPNEKEDGEEGKALKRGKITYARD